MRDRNASGTQGKNIQLPPWAPRASSRISIRISRPENVVALGQPIVDDAPELRIAFHAHVASKADWYEIADAVPQHDEEPTKRG